MLEAWCAASERCPQTFPLAARDRAECVDFACFAFTCRVLHDDARGLHRDEVAQVLPTASPARLSACSAYLAKASCDELERLAPPAFTRRAPGLAEAGACAGLLAGVDPRGFGLGEGRQCTSEPCAPGLDCAPAWVSRTAAERRCEACRKRPGEGEACTSADAGCAPGLVCQARLTVKTCVPPLEDGAACSAPFQCASGSCDPVSFKCAPRKAVGEACQRAEECASGRCDLGTTRTCAQGCRSSAACPAGQWCEVSTSACRPLGQDGAQCAAHAQCESGLCGAAGACAAAPPTGAACARHEDCAVGAWCSPRGCETQRGAGAECESSAACAPPHSCRQGTCQRADFACRPAPLGESCRGLGVCDGSAYCDGASLTCLPKKVAGAGCAGALECVAGSTCVGGVCGAPLGAGAACAAMEECAQDLRCEPDPAAGTPRCVAAPTGLPCGAAAPCPASHFCASTGRCEPWRELGQRCAVSAPCGPELYCEAGTVCRTRRDAGESCGPFVGCMTGLRCEDGGTCAKAGAVGALCSATDPALACAPGLYCDSSTTPPACAGQLGVGQACTQNAQCPSGACDPLAGCLASAACALVP